MIYQIAKNMMKMLILKVFNKVQIEVWSSKD